MNYDLNTITAFMELAGAVHTQCYHYNIQIKLHRQAAIAMPMYICDYFSCIVHTTFKFFFF